MRAWLDWPRKAQLHGPQICSFHEGAGPPDLTLEELDVWGQITLLEEPERLKQCSIIRDLKLESTALFRDARIVERLAV